MKDNVTPGEPPGIAANNIHEIATLHFVREEEKLQRRHRCSSRHHRHIEIFDRETPGVVRSESCRSSPCMFLQWDSVRHSLAGSSRRTRSCNLILKLGERPLRAVGRSCSRKHTPSTSRQWRCDRGAVRWFRFRPQRSRCVAGIVSGRP